jgi:hypothetical protein
VNRDHPGFSKRPGVNREEIIMRLRLRLDKDVLDAIPDCHGLYALCLADSTYAIYLRESGELWQTLAHFFPEASWDDAVKAAVRGEIAMCYSASAAQIAKLVSGLPGTSISFDSGKLFLTAPPKDGAAFPYEVETAWWEPG